jgi:sugar transferase (PEP-CTERM/EpsH1 system associated)
MVNVNSAAEADLAGDPWPAAKTGAPGTVNLLFLSHCVPAPPDKGEKIRAYHEIQQLASRYRIHLVCFARSQSEVQAAQELSNVCASVYAEQISPRWSLVRAAARFALGDGLNTAFYHSPKMRRYVASLAGRVPFGAALAYSVVMAPYAPPRIPLLLDMMDVDSEKWSQYAQSRRPGGLFRLEARRLRRFETLWAESAQRVALTTQNEEELLRTFAPQAATFSIENGVDAAFFDGQAHHLPPGLAGRRFVAFVGTMDYHPNIEAASWFARSILPQLRLRDPALEFFVVGRNPSSEISRLTRLSGVHTTGSVPDIRPYLASARAIVVPLRVARGIQNKVLEALAMGRPVYTTPEVCQTFGSAPPTGLVCCASEQEFVEGVSIACSLEPRCDPSIRTDACERFSWSRMGLVIASHLNQIARGAEA